jgi:hypothetical protein
MGIHKSKSFLGRLLFEIRQRSVWEDVFEFGRRSVREDFTFETGQIQT